MNPRLQIRASLIFLALLHCQFNSPQFSQVLTSRFFPCLPFSRFLLLSEGAFLVRDNRVLNEPLGRLLSSLACTAHFVTCSAALRFATLASLACSVHGLAHSLHSLPCGTVEIHAEIAFKGNKRDSCRHYKHALSPVEPRFNKPTSNRILLNE